MHLQLLDNMFLKLSTAYVAQASFSTSRSHILHVGVLHRLKRLLLVQVLPPHLQGGTEVHGG